MQAASPTDGLNLWLPLAANSPAVVQALARGGWLVRGGESFAVQTPVPGLRVTVSTIDQASAQAFSQAFSQALTQVHGQSAHPVPLKEHG